jgi:gliding motility-associated lipoprotein GldD
LNKVPVIFILLLVLLACKRTHVPKPRGHFRIDFPVKEYIKFDSTCPFTFEYPVYSRITADPNIKDFCWFDIDLPAYKGKIHITYKSVNNNLGLLTEDAHKLAYEHSVKADAIEERLWENEENNVYGIIYNIKGNAASSVQFFVTDSLSHYLRGALYFNTQPDKDSLAPVIDFFRQDIIHMIETLNWKQ